MYALTPQSTGKQIHRYLEDFSKNEIVALCAYLHNQTEYSVPSYGSKAQLLMGLRGIDREVLLSAVETLFNPCEQEEDTEDEWDEEAGEDEEEYEDDDDEEE